jgi:hypothetical protein
MSIATPRFHGILFLATIVIGLCAMVTVAAWSLNARFAQGGQTREKVIDKAFSHNSPVEIAEVKAAKNVVELGRAFDADDDWLSTILLKIKNISDKPIVYLAINVNFPETRATGSMMSYPVEFGQQPGSKFPAKRDPILMLPGDTLDIPLDKHYSRIKSFVEYRSRITDIRKLELEIGFVIFADRTAWAAGDFLRQDPNDPDHYINIGDKPEPTR